MNFPPVSAVVANYNHARLLPHALDALLGQSVLPREILVLDDASTDNSIEVIEAYLQRSPLIRLIRNERNLGVCATLNRGLMLAEGEYVGFFSADDHVLPGLFEHSLPLLVQYPNAGFVTGLCEWRCHTTGLKWLYGTTMPGEACYLSPPSLAELGRQGRLQVSAQPALYKRAALIEAGGWRPELRWHTDWFGSWVVAFRYGVCHVPQVLSVFNLYSNSYYHSVRSRRERRDLLGRILGLLESDRYSDVAPWIRASGLLGGFSWPMVRVILGDRRHWHFLSLSMIRHLARRSAEILGRRFFPNWLARFCLRVFYGRKT